MAKELEFRDYLAIASLAVTAIGTLGKLALDAMNQRQRNKATNANISKLEAEFELSKKRYEDAFNRNRVK